MKYHTVSSTVRPLQCKMFLWICGHLFSYLCKFLIKFLQEDGIVTEVVSFLSTSPSVVDDAKSGVKPECSQWASHLQTHPDNVFEAFGALYLEL